MPSYISTGKALIDPFLLLKDAGIAPGMHIADFGCGAVGHFVFPAAMLTGSEGKVYAVDILQSVLSSISARIKMERMVNVETVWGDIERPHGVSIVDRTLDMALVINNLYFAKNKEMMIKECTRTLKPRGLLVLVDWKPMNSLLGPQKELRVTAQDAKRLMEQAGLQTQKPLTPSEQHYGFVFQKK